MLTTFLIVLLLSVGVLLLLLFLPLLLVVDTVNGVYRIQWGPAWAGVSFTEDGVRYRLRLPFWTKEGDVAELFRTETSGPALVRSRETRALRRRPSIRAILGSFRVQRFRWVLDTDDPLWNAWLFPVFHLFSRQGRDVSISFTGRNELELIVSNNLYRLLKAVLLVKPIRTQQP